MATDNPFDIENGRKTPGIISQEQARTDTAAPSDPAQIGQPAAATPVQATADQAKAQQVTVDPATQTVQGQLAGILASGNPLLVQAQTRAKQDANARGLLNSTMAVSAGEDALYKTALPIASQDASTYGTAALKNADLGQETELTNMTARNRANELNTTEANTTSRFNVDQSNQVATKNAELQQQAILQKRDNDNKVLLQSMDAQTRVDLVNIEANYRTLMQASDSASSLYQQTLRNISDITANANMNAAAKNAAIAQQKALLSNGMNLIGAMNNLDVAALLDFSDLGGSPVPDDPVPAAADYVPPPPPPPPDQNKPELGA